MPNWKKLIVSGSDASLNSLNVTTNVTAQSFTGSFSGSFTAPGATTQVVYNNGGVLSADSGFVYSGSRVGIGTATPIASLDIRGTQTASSGTGRTMFISSSLSASANNNILVGLDINPSFNTGSFTGVSRTGARVKGKFTISALSTVSSPTDWDAYVDVEDNNTNNHALYIAPTDNATPRLYIGSSTRPVYTLNLRYLNSGIEGLNSLTLGTSYGYSLTFVGSTHQIGRTNAEALSFKNSFSAGYFRWEGISSSEVMRLYNTSGNLLLGTTVDNGYKIQATATNTNSGSLFLGGTTVATGSIARTMFISSSLSASANNDVLVALDINPSFNTGAFTGTTSYAARIQSGTVVYNNTSPGIKMFNTVDQLTNTEYANIGWSSNVFNIYTVPTGTGSQRDLGLYSGLIGRGITIRRDGGPTGHIQFNAAGNSAIGSVSYNFSGMSISSGGQQYGLYFTPNVTQTGTGSYSMFYISTYESTVGTGVKNLIDVGTNSATGGTGTHTTKFAVQSDGFTNLVGRISSSIVPANNPSASLMLIGGTTIQNSTLSGSSAVLVNTVMSASANNQTLVGLDINPSFNTGAFTGTSTAGLRTPSALITDGSGNYTLISRSSGASGRLRIYRPNSTSAVAVSFGTGNSELEIGSSNHQITGNGGIMEITGNTSITLTTTTTSGVLTFRNSNTELGKVFSTGNFLLQASGSLVDAGFKLDVSGSTRLNGNTTITGSLIVTNGITGSLSGSATNAVSSSYALTSSYASFAQTAGAASTATSASYALSASYATSASYAVTSSYALTASYVNPLNQDLIITGSIIVTGGVTASNALITGNLSVLGTASFVYTTASVVTIGGNLITLNTDNPSVRFAGITVVDSGSFGNSSTGSLFWDSQNNRWIYSNPSGSSYDGGMFISGPRNTSGLGNEQGTTLNAILKGQGGDHLTSSGMFEDSSGNVGVGTASPSAKFEVIGNIKATSFTGSFSGSVSAPGSTTQIVYNSGGALAADSGLVYSGSNVGIGISTPTDKLHIVSSATGNQFGRITATDSGASAAWVAQNDSGDNVVYRVFGSGVGGTQMGAALGRSASLLANLGGSGVFLLGTFSNTDFILGTNNTENMRITTAGNVGIGTSSPTKRFHVRDTTSPYQINLQSDTSKVWAAGVGISGYYQDWFLLSDGTSDIFRINAGYTEITNTIYASANIGIGTASPSQKLEVNGGDALIRTAYIGNISAFGTDYASFSHIARTGSGDYSFLSDNSGITYINAKASNSIKFRIDNIDKAIIDSSGNVGIGTTSPLSKLHVEGANDLLTLKMTSGGYNALTLSTTFGGGNNYVINPYITGISNGGFEIKDITNNVSRIAIAPSTGNVGIGTTNPSEKLTVGNGNIVISGSDSTNYLIGVKSLNSNNDINGGLEVYQINGWGSKVGIKTGRANGGWGGQYALYSETVDDANLSYPSQSAHTKFNSKTTASYGPAVVYIDSGSGGTIPSIHTYNGAAFAISTGSVGIGTTNPSQKLSVVGAVSASTYYGDGSNLTNIGSGSVAAAGSDGQLQYNNSGLFGGASRLYYNDSTNRVGIGTSSPGYDLDVSGSARVQDRLRVGSINSGNGVIHQSSDATINPTSATVVWTVSGTTGICAFIEYYLLNSNTGTSQRAGNIVTTWNAAGTPQITHTETSTPDVGSTSPITFSTVLTLGGDPQLIATNSGGDSWYMIMNYRYF